MARVSGRRHSGRRIIAGLTIVIAGTVGTVAAVALTATNGAGGDTHASTITEGPVPQSQVPAGATLSQMEAQGIASINANAPKPTLPPDQRAAWVAAFQAMANCMHAHGITGFPNAPATFGDGKTSAPVIDGTPGSDMDPQSSAFQSASAGCPMDTSKLSIPEFQSSWNQWQASHPSTGSGPAVPGQQAATP